MSPFEVGVCEGMIKVALPVVNERSRKWAQKAVQESDVKGAFKSAWKASKAEHMARKPPRGSGFLRKLKWAVIG